MIQPLTSTSTFSSQTKTKPIQAGGKLTLKTNQLLEQLLEQQAKMNDGIGDLVAFQEKSQKNKPSWLKRMITDRIPSAAVVGSVFVAVRYAFNVAFGI